MNKLNRMYYYIKTHLGKIPRAADQFEWNGLKFEVLDMDRNRVDKLMVKQSPSE